MENRKAWIYCRTAYPDAYALAVQQASLEAFAERLGFEVVGTTVKHASGFDYSRRGLTEVFNAVNTGAIDILLVTNLSRLGRNLKKTDYCLRWLEDRFVDVVCADGTIPQTSTEMLRNQMRTRETRISDTK